MAQPDDIDAPIAAFWELMKSRDPKFQYLTHYRMKHKNGEYVWFREHGGYLKDESDTLLRIVGGARNISDENIAEIAQTQEYEQVQSNYIKYPLVLIHFISSLIKSFLYSNFYTIGVTPKGYLLLSIE